MYYNGYNPYGLNFSRVYPRVVVRNFSVVHDKNYETMEEIADNDPISNRDKSMRRWTTVGGILGGLGGVFGANALGAYADPSSDILGVGLPLGGFLTGASLGAVGGYLPYRADKNRETDSLIKELQANGIENPTKKQISEYWEDKNMRARGKEFNKNALETIRYSYIPLAGIVARNLIKYPPEFISSLPDSIYPEYSIPALAAGATIALGDWNTNRVGKKWRDKGWI